MFYKDSWALPENDFCDKLTRTWAMFEIEHENKLDYFLSTVFSEDTINQSIDKWCQQIENATIEAREIHDDAISFEKWKDAVTDLKNEIEYSRNHLNN